MGSCLLALVSFLDLCIFDLIRKLRGKTQKRQVMGENKKQMAPTLPHPPSTQITSTHLHTPPTPTLTLFLGPHDGVVVSDDLNLPLF